MCREVIVYDPTDRSPTMADVLARMAERGCRLHWDSHLLTERGQLRTWTSGELRPETRDRPRLTLAREPVRAADRDELLAAYGGELTLPQRDALAAAQGRFVLADFEGFGGESDEVLIDELADVLAGASGLVHDKRVGRFFAPGEFRPARPPRPAPD